MKQLISQFWFLLDKKSKTDLPYLMINFIFLSLLDVLNIGLVGIFLGLLTHSSAILQHYTDLMDSHLTENELIVYFGLFIVAAFFIKTYLALLLQKKIVFYCQFVSVQLKERLMSTYQYAPYRYHLQTNSATMLSKIHMNIDHFALNTLMSILNLISNALISLAILIFLTFLHPVITLILLLLFALFGLGCDLFAKKRLILMGSQVSKNSGEIIKSINQGLHGLNEIRVLNREEYFLNALKRVTACYAHSRGTLAALQLVPRYLIESIMVLFAVGLSFSGIALGLDTRSIVILTGLFATAGVRLMPMTNQIISSFQQIRSSYHHAKVVYDDLIELTPFVETSQLALPCQDKCPFFKIQLRDVTYYYPKAAHPALLKVNMTILKGQSIGLIGPSGAGKSTLINIILGMLEPDEGFLLVDDKPVSSLRAWLNNFAYIPQVIFLLDDTIRRNVAFGIEDEFIDDKLVWQAINMAQLLAVVNQLPRGLDTVIGENGIRLSGGQRQRMALARAFYHERDILILDEATSSLDHETECEVINTIKRLKGNKTLIVIAHRMSTVEHCDRLFCLEKGGLMAPDFSPVEFLTEPT